MGHRAELSHQSTQYYTVVRFKFVKKEHNIKFETHWKTTPTVILVAANDPNTYLYLHHAHNHILLMRVPLPPSKLFKKGVGGGAGGSWEAMQLKLQSKILKYHTC